VAGINIFATRLPPQVLCQRDNSVSLGAILTFLKSEILINSTLFPSPISYSDEGCGFSGIGHVCLY
jgi:hypothetical protein